MSLRNISDPWKTIMADGLLSELKKSISNADIFCNHPQKYVPNGHISKLLDEAITALKQKNRDNLYNWSQSIRENSTHRKYYV